MFGQTAFHLVGVLPKTTPDPLLFTHPLAVQPIPGSYFGHRCYRFFFYAGDRNEPAHTHVQRDTEQAKFWLAPVRLAWNRGFSAAELRRIERLTEENEDRLLEIWNDYFDIGE